MAGSLSRRRALAARGRPVGYGVAWPPGSGPGDRLPVCLLLHAAGDRRAPFERLRLHHHLAQAAVLGWSMGGAGALRLAETHPDRLVALVAASPAVDPAGARSP